MRLPFSITLAAALALLVSAAPASAAGDPFDRFFTDRTLRVDYYHVGDAQVEWVTLDRVYEQGPWAGSTVNLVDTLNNGNYYVKVFDLETNQLIFSRGFDSYFREYQTTELAARGEKRTFHESLLMPRPKGPVQWTLEHRDRMNVLRPVFTTVIDPGELTVARGAFVPGVEVLTLHEGGDPHACVDVLLVADGYTAAEEEKFAADCRRLAALFLAHEPYAGMKSSFNIRGAFKASGDSDVSKPHFGEWRSTAVGSSFYSLASSRYLLTEENRALRDVAAHAPYDALIILANTRTYGGGGIYNLYATAAVDNQWTDYVFLHEFGHSFAGLADEYYSSSTSYDEEAFYPKGVEPREPNITRLIGDPQPKWKTLLDVEEVPTPWGKEEYDRKDEEYQKVREKLNQRIAAARRSAGPAEEIAALEEESERLSREAAQRTDEILRGDPFFGKVGVYEGAGYTSKGVYRPEVDCLMFTKGAKPFCKVCRAAVERTIRFHTGQPLD